MAYSIQERKGKKRTTYQYTISRMVNGVAKPIRKGGFRTKGEARAAAIEVEAQLNKGIVPFLEPQPIDEYFDNWVKLYKDQLSIATRKHYNYTFERIKEFFGSKPLQQISKHDYQRFLNQLGTNKSKETVQKVNGHIRSCVRDAVDQQIIPHDFTRNTTIKFTVPAKEKEEKHLSFADSKLLLKTLKNRLSEGLGYYLLLLGLVTGMRFEELVGLTFNDFDFENNTITVNKTWGYTNRMPEGFGLTKNKASNRTITLDNNTMNLFKELFENLPDNTNHLVFYNPRSKYKVISNEHANSLLKDILLELNIRPIITMHGLRHTHGSVLIYQKASYKYTSMRLGHTDLDVTMRVYIHLIKELREEDEDLTIKTLENMYE